MKYKNILNTALTFVVGLLFVACSQSDDVSTSPSAVKMQNGFYVYDNIDFVCQAPGYDAGTTRAVTYNWQYGQTMFARFKSGSTYYQGFIYRKENGWSMIATSDFMDMATSGTCELYYFQEANGDYYYLNTNTGNFDIYNNGSFVKNTDIVWNSKSISLSEGTAVYTSTANYSTTATSFSLETVLEPLMWRMRFSGSNGTSITLPGSGNDIEYCSAFNWSTSSAYFSTATKDVSLSVSGGYTPYIYGLFASTGSNKITVKNGNDAYTRNLNASSLPVGTSGYFDIPTESNYSSKGWTKNVDVLCEVPCLNWGASVATVKTWMTNNGFTLWAETTDWISYDPKHREEHTAYLFSEGALYWAGITFNPSTVTLTEIEDFVKSTGATRDNSSSGIRYITSDGKSTIDIYDSSDTYSLSYMAKTTSSNIDANATIEPNLLVPFIDGMVTDWTIGSTVNTFDYSVFTKAGAEALTDDEIVEKIYGTDPYSKDDASYIFRNNNTESNQFYSPNTQYYLCAVAKNSSGKRGPVCRYLFMTSTDGLPTALISNITPETTKWTYNITLRNGATSYYLGTSTDENRYKSDWHFWAYLVYKWGVTGQIEAHDWASVQTTLNSGTCNVITIGTWGISSNGSIGNPEVAYGNVSSSAPAWTQKAPKSTVREEAIPRADLEKIMKNTRFYRVNR